MSEGGGGGGSRPDCQNTAMITLFLVLSVFYRGGPMFYQWFYFRKNYSFSRNQTGV